MISLSMRLAYHVLTSMWKEYSFVRSVFPSAPQHPPAAILRGSCMVPSSLLSRMATFEMYPCTNRCKIVRHCIIVVYVMHFFVDVVNSLQIVCKNSRFSSQSSLAASSTSMSPPDPSGTLLDCPGVSWSLSEHPLENSISQTLKSIQKGTTLVMRIWCMRIYTHLGCFQTNEILIYIHICKSVAN